MRRYEVIITPRSLAKPLRMRQVQAATIGSLVTVRVWPPSWTPPPQTPAPYVHQPCRLCRLCCKQRRSEAQSDAIWRFSPGIIREGCVAAPHVQHACQQSDGATCSGVPAGSIGGAHRDASSATGLQGIVTNATDVKPMLTVATYLDAASGLEVYQEVTGDAAPPRANAPGCTAPINLDRQFHWEHDHCMHNTISSSLNPPSRSGAVADTSSTTVPLDLGGVEHQRTFLGSPEPGSACMQRAAGWYLSDCEKISGSCSGCKQSARIPSDSESSVVLPRPGALCIAGSQAGSAGSAVGPAVHQGLMHQDAVRIPSSTSGCGDQA